MGADRSERPRRRAPDRVPGGGAVETGRRTTDRALEDWRRHGAAGSAAAIRRSLGAGDLASAAAATARRVPHGAAITVGDTTLDHGTLDDRSRRLAGWCATGAAMDGARVLIVAPNSVELVVAYLAALRGGAMVTLVSPAVPERELDVIADQVRPDVVIAPAEAATTLGRRGARALRVDGAGPGSLAAAIAASAPAADAPMGPETIAHLAFTSGTTGRPKATPLTHGNVLASVRSIVTAWRWDPGDVLVHALPLQHSHGLTAVHLTALTGSHSVVLPRFDASALGATVAAARATVLFGVPALYERLLAADHGGRQPWSSLRLVTSGSAALAPRTSDALTGLFGMRPLERYGLTETGFLLSNPYDGERRAGSVGFALPGVEVAIVDAAGQAIDDGAEGEIVARGPSVFEGYLDETGDEHFLPGRWFRTGDLGLRDPTSGAVSITGRLKELIITGGLNVSPREVELVLEARPGVVAAAVVGRPSPQWGEEVTAFVEAAADLDVTALAEAVAPLLAPHKRPKRYVLVDALPRNHLGKIVKSQLAP